MKNSKRVFSLLSLVVILVVSGFTLPILSNLWLISTGKGFFIPGESSVWTFKVVEMNEGSGEWWVYAEDAHNFYFNYADGQHSYVHQSKSVECDGFQLLDVQTWCPQSIEVERQN